MRKELFKKKVCPICHSNNIKVLLRDSFMCLDCKSQGKFEQFKNIKPSCVNCCHLNVCSIYHSNIRMCKDLNIKFRVSTIADICKDYKLKEDVGGMTRIASKQNGY